MADPIVGFVLNQLSTLLHDEAILLGSLRQEIQLISDELGHVRAFLRVAEAKEDDDPRLVEWIKQVQDLANDIEGIVDEFMLHFTHYGRRGIYGQLRRIIASPKTFRARHRIASEVQNIKARITNISEGHKRYECEHANSDQVTEFVALNNTWRYNKDDALLIEESKLVGINKPKQLLVSQLVDGDSQFKVVSVLGMGGIGKTTLVKKVQQDAKVKAHFQILAWVTVSQNCDMKELLKDLIQQLYQEIGKPVPQQVALMTVTDRLKAFVKHFLQDKKYLIVFDDVWDVKFWDVVKFTLPEGNCGNRVMLTTRIADVAYAPCVELHSYVHRMQPLSSEESWTLFCKKTFNDNCCPNHLKEVARGILRKCEGLPLAIVTISGVLALKDKNKLDEWKIVQLSLGGELEGSGKLDRIKKILSLSYDELPYHLKNCLLYVSIYPEDYRIESEQLIRLWVSEGFVQERTGMTKYEVARACLDDLANRSLIQLANGKNGGVSKMYRIHDLLRELLLSMSSKQHFATIATGQQIRWPEKIRRLAIHDLDFIGDVQQSIHCKYLRSLVTFKSMRSVSKSFLSKVLSGGSRLLKTLDLEGAQLEEIPDKVFKLFHLRYLSLAHTRVKIFPKSIGHLKNLEVLNLACTNVTELPSEILKLQGLIQLVVFGLHVDSYDYTLNGFKAPNKIGRLLSLEWLFHVEADSNGVIVAEIGKLKQLKRLGITNVRREDGKEICSSLGKLPNLEHLYVQSIQKDEVIDLNHLNHYFCPGLELLFLSGRLEKVPQFISALESLTMIELCWSRLMDDPLESLERLPNLRAIHLNQAYLGESLCFKAGRFLKLELLALFSIQTLRWLTVEKGAMPNLQELRMRNLKLLEEFPLGIQHLTNLQSLYLGYPNEKLAAFLKDRCEDYRRICHIPEIFIWNDEDGWCRHPLYWEETK